MRETTNAKTGTTNKERTMSSETTTTTTYDETYAALGEFRKVMHLIGHAISADFCLGETRNPFRFYVDFGGLTFCLSIEDTYKAAGNNLSMLLEEAAMSLGTDGEIICMETPDDVDGCYALTMAEALFGAASVIDLPTTKHAHTAAALRTTA